VAILGDGFTIIFNCINIAAAQGRVYYDNVCPQETIFWQFFENFRECFSISLTTSGCVIDVGTVYVFVNTSEAHVKNKGI
jgi:hypothetical protein